MRRLGSQYVLHSPLGRGASGEVWRGEREEDGTPVAVKILRAELADDTDVVERFLRERKVLLGFDHPHLVKVRDLVAEGGTLAIVMDLVDGVDLRRYLRERDLLAPREAVDLVGQVLDALATVHAKGVVHRDVKPENILVDTTDPGRPQALLTDFGIARLTHGPSMTRLTGLIGTPRYMAPELSEGTRATPAADLYSVGIVLYELLSGRPPFDAEHPIAMLRSHLEKTPAPLEGLPGTLWVALAELLAKSPADRPATAGRAHAELMAALAGTGSGETVISPGLNAPLLMAGDRGDDTIRSPMPGTGLDPASAGPGPAGGGTTADLPGPSEKSERGRGRARWPIWTGVGLAAAVALAAGSWTLTAVVGGGSGSDGGVRVAAATSTTAAGTANPALAPTAGPAVAGGGGSGSDGGVRVAAATSTTAAATANPAPASAAGPAVAGGQPAERPSDRRGGAEPVADQPSHDGRVVVPGVLTMVLNDAAAILRSAGFSNIPYVYECYGSTQLGNVVRQDPAAGSRRTPTAPVHLYLQARNCATVPDVRGMSLADAAATLRQLGFSDIPYVYECLGSPRTGAVATQSPAPGTSQGTSRAVNLRLQANNC